jgi:hypothetical protein
MNLTDLLNNVGNRINGTTLRKPDLNLVAKLDAMGITLKMGDLQSDGLVFTRNPVSRNTAMLNPFISALINWTFEVYSSYDPMAGDPMNYRGTKVAIGTYDRVRMLVLSLDSEAYSNFLD